MKIIITKVPTDLVKNFVLCLFYLFVETKNENQILSADEKYFCFWFIASRALL